MSTLKEKLQKLKTIVARAIDYANPAELIEKALHSLLEHAVEEIHALKDRVTELELQVKQLLDPTASNDASTGVVEGEQGNVATDASGASAVSLTGAGGDTQSAVLGAGTSTQPAESGANVAAPAPLTGDVAADAPEAGTAAPGEQGTGDAATAGTAEPSSTQPISPSSGSTAEQPAAS